MGHYDCEINSWKNQITNAKADLERLKLDKERAKTESQKRQAEQHILRKKAEIEHYKENLDKTIRQEKEEKERRAEEQRVQNAREKENERRERDRKKAMDDFARSSQSHSSKSSSGYSSGSGASLSGCWSTIKMFFKILLFMIVLSIVIVVWNKCSDSEEQATEGKDSPALVAPSTTSPKSSPKKKVDLPVKEEQEAERMTEALSKGGDSEPNVAEETILDTQEVPSEAFYDQYIEKVVVKGTEVSILRMKRGEIGSPARRDIRKIQGELDDCRKRVEKGKKINSNIEDIEDLIREIKSDDPKWPVHFYEEEMNVYRRLSESK